MATLSMNCPNCGHNLCYEEGEKSVFCNSCDQYANTSQAAAPQSIPAVAAVFGTAAPTVGFDNPESGVVFLEHFFDTYDWDAYKQTSAFEIPEIDDVIKNNTQKNGAIPSTWYLDYQALYVPTLKKFEALDELAKEIADKYDPLDQTEVMSSFDTYCRIAKKLKTTEDEIIKKLEADIKYAEKFGLAADKIESMKAGVYEIIKRMAAIPLAAKQPDNAKVPAVIDSIEELPQYLEARKLYSKRLLADYRAQGIDAESIYTEAIAYYNDGDVNSALQRFELISEYSDSRTYINKMNRYFKFEGLRNFLGGYYIFKEEDYQAGTLDVKGLKKSKKGDDAAAEATTALSLYPVVDGRPASEPILRGVEATLACYGTKLFYFKSGEGIYSFDINSKIETVVDSGKPEDYCRDSKGKLVWNTSKSKKLFWVMRTQVEEEKKGCFGGKKKEESADAPLNPYSIIVIDMASNSSRVLVRELVEISLIKGDKLFYKHAMKVIESKKVFSGCSGKKANVEEAKHESVFMMCDIGKGTDAKILDEDCEIFASQDNYIIYALWKPNRLNKELYVYDITTGTSTLIEKNVFDFFAIIKNKVYYTIGNEKYQPLVRANFDGTEREQIQSNVESFIGERAGWLYVKKGRGINSVLVKVTADGKKRVVVCTQFEEYITFTENYVYYVDTFDNLRRVRIDGKENVKLADDVDDVFLTDNGIYYKRKEAVSEYRNLIGLTDNTNLSLYKMDKDGNNIQKMVFDIDKVLNDKDDIFYCKKEDIRYKVCKLNKKGKGSEYRHEIYTITKYYKFNKATEETELILTAGLPDDIMKKGCLGLGKPKKVDMLYEEDPIIHSYSNRYQTDAEIAANEEPDEDIERSQNAGCGNKNAGCGNQNAGCSSIFDKLKANINARRK